MTKNRPSKSMIPHGKIVQQNSEIIEKAVEINVRGKLVTFPALKIDGHVIFVKGRWIKVAAIRSENWMEKELEDPELCVQILKGRESRGLRADIFTFAQKPPTTDPKYSYPMEWDSVAAADTTSFERWWGSLPQETRKNVRRSQRRGVVIKVSDFSDDLIRGIMAVNNDSPIRQGARNRYYGRTFDEVKRDHSSFVDRSDFICAYFAGELIGFLKLVHRGEVASILNLVTKPSHNDKRPANALMSKAVELCAAKGKPCLIYGMFNYGNKRNSPLLDFKVRNGFQEILVPRFYVPLTIKGEILIKLNLHRDLLQIVPSSIIRAFVSLRARWYGAFMKPV